MALPVDLETLQVNFVALAVDLAALSVSLAAIEVYFAALSPFIALKLADAVALSIGIATEQAVSSSR